MNETNVNQSNMGANTSQNQSLDIEYIQKKLEEGYQYTKLAERRQLVLMIGNTGVGKSTTGNYLLGHRMKEAKYIGSPVIETVDSPSLVIGHQINAETLYAKPIVRNDLPWVLTDCPGFLGNRTKIEDRIIESISTELAIRNANEIKGVLILISINHLLETKIGDLRGLIKTLVSLFKDPLDMVHYSTFIITKKFKFMPEEYAKQITEGAILKVIQHCEECMNTLGSNIHKKSTDGLTIADYYQIKAFFSELFNKKDEIVFVDPLDNGESRQLIIDRVNGIKPRKGFIKEMIKGVKDTVTSIVGHQTEALRPITIDDFNFVDYDEFRPMFNNVIYNRVHDDFQLMNTISRSYKMISEAHATIKDNEKRLELENELKANLESGDSGSDHEKNQLSIKTWNDIILHNKESIDQLEIEINNIDEILKESADRLKKIDIDKPMAFLHKEINQEKGGILRSVFIPFGWERLEFNANTGNSDIPIINVTKSLENGSWSNEDDRRSIGIYKVTYESDYRASPAKASVTTYIKTRDDKGNKLEISQTKQRIELITKDRLKNKNTIAELTSRNQVLQHNIEMASNGMLTEKEEQQKKIADCELAIKNYTHGIVQSKQIIEQAKVNGFKQLQEFQKDQQKFEMLVDIGTLLVFPSSVVKQFIVEYKEFLKNLNKYNLVFTQGDNINISISTEENNVSTNNYNDPITGKPIREPVVTRAGYLFDLYSLRQQFGPNKSIPFYFKHKNGVVEEIKYDEWTKSASIKKVIEDAYQGPPIESSFNFSFKIEAMSRGQLEEEKGKVEQRIAQTKKQLEELDNKLQLECIQLDKINRRLANSPESENKVTSSSSRNIFIEQQNRTIKQANNESPDSLTTTTGAFVQQTMTTSVNDLEKVGVATNKEKRNTGPQQQKKQSHRSKNR